MKSIASYAQLRDASKIHLATTSFDEISVTRSFFLLCHQGRANLKFIDPIHHQRFGWDAHPELRCPKCLDAIDPKPKKGAA